MNDYVNGEVLDFEKPLMNKEHAEEVQKRLEDQKKKEEEKLPM
jgi:hypothetical protein